MDVNSIKPRVIAANKSLLALAAEAGVKYQRLYLASRGVSSLTPEYAEKIETVLQSWGV